MRAAITLALALLVVAPGTAAWQPTGTGTGKAKAKSMPTTAPAAPTATVSSHDVTVTWTASTFLEGGAVPSYKVRRYDALSTLQTIGAACSGTVTGTSCIEHVVPAGTWFYTVTPLVGIWQNAGTESPKGSAVIVLP